MRGRARLIEAGAVHDRVAAEWYFEIDDTYHLFEFGIETALLGVRDGPDEWPPRYTSWTSPAPRRAPAAR